MFVRAKRDFDCPSHKLRKGQEADLPEEFAQAAIDAGDAVAVESERAIDRLTGAVKRGRPSKTSEE